jgi:hypothetical protein
MGRARIAFVVAVLAARPAAASHDWKDGCPTYDDDPLPLAGRFGISPELDTALGPSRVALQSDFSQMAVPIDAENVEASRRAVAQPWTTVGQVVGQLNLRQGPTLTLHYGGLYASDMRHVGNIGGALGYRYTDFSFGDALRWGLAARLGEDVSLTAGNCQPVAPTLACASSTGGPRDPHQYDLLSATIRTPFHPRWFGFDHLVSGVVEARVEMVGCHSPFLHLRAELNRWRTPPLQAMPVPENKAPAALAVPITLTAGGYMSPRWGAAGELGIELRSPRSVVLANTIARARVLVDFRVGTHDSWWQHVHFGGYAGVVSGDAQGIALGVTAAYELRGDSLTGDEDVL